MTEYTDAELIDLFRGTDSNRHYAFNLIVQRYQQRVYQHIRRMVIDHDDTNDLVQNTFIKVWQHLDEFRQDSQLFTWIYRIATNECLGFLKQKRKRFFLPINDVEGELNQLLERTASPDYTKLELKLQQSILRLPEKQRLVFHLR